MKLVFQKIIMLSAAVCALARGVSFCAGNMSPVDEEKIIISMRKSLSVPPSMEIKILNYKTSPIPGYLQATVELRKDNNTRNENVLISSDSRYFIVGSIFDTNVNLDAVRYAMINLDNSPSKGDPKAPIKVVEYSDYQCESCKIAFETLEKENFPANYGGKVRFIYKQFPFEHHSWARQASIACLCAYELKPDSFWEMHKLMFTKQNEIVPENLRVLAMDFVKTAGLDQQKYFECYDKQLTQGKITADMAEGKALGVYSTPSFIVNGRLLVGLRNPAELKILIEEFLSKK